VQIILTIAEEYDMTPADLGIESLDEKIYAKESAGSDNYVRLPEKDGFVILRFLPKLKNREFFVAARIHRLGAYPNSKSVFCPHILTQTARGERWLADSKRPCPICKKYNEMWEQINKMTNTVEAEKAKDVARSIKPAERFYYNVIVRQQVNSKTKTLETNVGPKIYSCPKQVQTIIRESIQGSEVSGRRKLGDVANIATGRDFRLVKQIKGGTYPDYGQSSFEDVSPLGTDAEIRNWVSSYHDIEKIPVFLSYEEMEKSLKLVLEEKHDTNVKSSEAQVPQAKGGEKTSNGLSSELEGVLDSDWETALKNIGVQ
jgi:hypothetical protein